ncbi:inhibitor of vertebrate lysozyme family protein [Pseudomonas sp. SL4(2022)]|uniref:inhibitor of vertebrate lysozyme family protein n=1 Tax=Pseudomonas sp. SL4(2022) TaxID=2994661 RepID=UPI002270E5F0|nr:inhibitor of vertebrate lysozyme family protein [Pseudomonas sp. SL4(2022)]WAC46016.1 inhibitor of vertebrate lysozyme family protein [Pseudomonas sp. SL4(2022)]
MTIKTLLAALLLGGSVAALAADTDGQFRLNELLASDSAYQETWQELVQGESRLPDWVMNLSGIASPMQGLDDDGDQYLVGQLCEANNCFNQRLYVAFSWDKDDAYALYVQLPDGLPTDKAPSQHATLRWLGDPDDAIQQLLQEQLNNDPNWY